MTRVGSEQNMTLANRLEAANVTRSGPSTRPSERTHAIVTQSGNGHPRREFSSRIS